MASILGFSELLATREFSEERRRAIWPASCARRAP